MLTWTVCYPADFLKTRLQTMKPEHGRVSLFNLALDIYNERGFLSMYKGIHVQLMRAFPSNAAAMIVFEQVKAFL